MQDGFAPADYGLPFSLSAEKSVIGCVLADNGKRGVLGEVMTVLRADHFYVEKHRAIYEVMSRIFMSGRKPDAIIILNECIKEGIFENEAQASAQAKEFIDSAPSASAITAYAPIIIEKAMMRNLLDAAKDIINSVSEGKDTAEKLVDEAEHRIYNIRAVEEDRSLTHISGIVFDRIKELSNLAKEAAENNGEAVMKGLSTGFDELDRLIYGLNPSDLVILAARPGMGKTSFAMNIAVNVAKKYRDKKICVFSLEMSKEQIVSRMLNSEALLPSEAMKTGRIAKNKWDDVRMAADALSQLPIYIDDTPACSVTAVKSKVRRMKEPGVVVIDYLQLMTSAHDYHGNRVSEISEITRNLKIMAKELNVPVVVLSQLARGPEQRPDKRPMLSDLRDSGSIEQDADVVLFLYRESYYNKEDPNKELCECNVSKNRHGETGVARIGWKGEYTRFFNAKF